MDLLDLKNKVKDFEVKAEFDKTEFSQLILMFEEEVAILKKSSHDKAKVDHQLTDLLILIMQLAGRYETNFDNELETWFEKSKKYYN